MVDEFIDENGNPVANRYLLRKKVGREKGSTNAEKFKHTKDRKDATDWVCSQFAAAKNDVESKYSKVKQGLRSSLFQEAISHFQIVGDFDIPDATIQSRVMAGNISVNHLGTPAPLLVFETLFWKLLSLRKIL